MRLFQKFTLSLCAVAAIAFGSAASAVAQSTAATTAGNGTYVAIDPLAGVRYDNRYDVSLGMAYRHIKAGPNLNEGANLGGLDLNGSYWLSKHWGVEGNTRVSMGTSGAAPNTKSIQGPFISEYLFAAGPEYLGPHNKHAALIPHLLVGGVYGKFEQDLRGNSPSVVAFYNDQLAPAAVMGGHIDLNRSANWVFRVSPDFIYTHYGINYGNESSQSDINFAISVGFEYKFNKKKR